MVVAIVLLHKKINNNGMKVRMATLGLYGQGSSQSDRRWTGALLLMKFGKVRLRARVAFKWMIGNCWGNCPAIRVCSFLYFPTSICQNLYVYIAVDTVVWMQITSIIHWLRCDSKSWRHLICKLGLAWIRCEIPIREKSSLCLQSFHGFCVNLEDSDIRSGSLPIMTTALFDDMHLVKIIAFAIWECSNKK